MIIRAIIGFVTWVVGTILIFQSDWKLAIGITLITLSIYNDLKTLIKNPNIIRT